jgi:hypothetical protein
MSLAEIPRAVAYNSFSSISFCERPFVAGTFVSRMTYRRMWWSSDVIAVAVFAVFAVVVGWQVIR